MITMYGMKSRGFSPGCQPMDGLVAFEDDKEGIYYSILYYSRKLTDDEIESYELKFLEVVIR